MILDREVLLASPLSTLAALGRICLQRDFWEAIAASLGRITLGFCLGTGVGALLAALSHRFSRVRRLLAPFFAVVKSVPVASFVILALLWVRGSGLSVFISFLMALPIVFRNVSRGFSRVDPNLLEMAKVFRIKPGQVLRYIYVPRIAPYFASACSTALGLCWKSGVAAEVIGLPRRAIGTRLYETKIYLDTPRTFAWTLVIVAISFAGEKVFSYLLDKVSRRIKKEYL